VKAIKSSKKRKAGVAKLVDALDLGSSAARRGGSSPSTRTTFQKSVLLLVHFFLFSKNWYSQFALVWFKSVFYFLQKQK
jgi:hypothetical protein